MDKCMRTTAGTNDSLEQWRIKRSRSTYTKTLEAVRLVTLELGHLLLNDLWADDWSNLHHLQSQHHAYRH